MGTLNIVAGVTEWSRRAAAHVPQWHRATSGVELSISSCFGADRIHAGPARRRLGLVSAVKFLEALTLSFVFGN
jgi:hypothetical protein